MSGKFWQMKIHLQLSHFFMRQRSALGKQNTSLLLPKNVEMKQILKFRRKHLCGIISTLTLVWMCDMDRQSHESPALAKLHKYSIVSVQSTQPVFCTRPNDPSHWLFIPSFRVHALLPARRHILQPFFSFKDLTSAYLIQRSLPISHKKRSDLPKGWTIEE